ncbi:HNH endonuclease [Zymobacter sp. IVIA_5232.4 C2]|uniref:HNH endonuclease n=1 Tax=Zymobacter sp. IVIA_5232.4 C2 TaxID=3394855 RepID=UPI0039C2BC1C
MKNKISISPGSVISNQELCEKFRCGPQGGMRRSNKTNSLVLITDLEGSNYKDEWQDEILLYTGMGQVGNQELNKYQNKTLNDSPYNNITIFYFEKHEPNHYCYVGIMEKVKPAYSSIQPDKNGSLRKVWIFPLKLLSKTIPSSIAEKTALYEVKKEHTLYKKSKISLYRKASKINQRSYRKHITNQYIRSPEISALIKKEADGHCDLCNNKAPFLDTEGLPFLECHHIEWLANGGIDCLDNTVALCPNCHRKMHILNNKDDINNLKQIARQRIKEMEKNYRLDNN